MIITALVHVSKREPSLIALRMPSGIEMAYDSRVIRRPSEIETRVVPQHQAEALQRRLVEAELLLQLLDEFRIEALGAAVLGVEVGALAEILVGASSGEIAAAAGDPRRRR